MSEAELPGAPAPPGVRPFADLMSGMVAFFVIGALAKLVQLAATIVFLRLLTTEEYGVQALVLLNEQVLMTVAGYAFTNPIGRYFAESRREGGDGGDVAGTALVAMLAVALIVAVVWQAVAAPVGHLILGHTRDAVLFTRLVGASFVANLVILLVTTVWQLERRYVAFALATIGQYVGFGALGLVLVAGFDTGAVGMVSAWVVASIGVAVASVIALSVQLRLSYDRGRLSQLLRYGGPLVPAAVVTIVLASNDRYLLSRIDSLSAVGVYAAVLTVVFGLNAVIVGPFKRIWFSLVWQLRDDAREKEFHRRVLTWFATGQVVLVVGLALFGDLIMTVVGGQRYAGAGAALAIVYGGLALWESSSILAMGYFFADRTVLYTVTVGASTVVAVAWNVALIGRWGLWGAAWSNPVGYAVFAILSVVFARPYFRPGFEWGRLAELGALGAVGVAAGLAARTLGGVPGVGLAVIVLAALVAGLGLLRVVSVEDLRALRAVAGEWRVVATRRFSQP